MVRKSWIQRRYKQEIIESRKLKGTCSILDIYTIKVKLKELNLIPAGGELQVVSQSDINDFERILSKQLPGEYKWFLCEYGACCFRDNVIFKAAETCPWFDDGVGAISYFYGLRPAKNNLPSLEQALESYRDQLPPNTIPIGDDMFGNLICLDLAKDNYGKVLFWNHESETEQEQFCLIADSFEKFLGSFYELPEQIT